jgi:hypothetical protein
MNTSVLVLMPMSSFYKLGMITKSEGMRLETLCLQIKPYWKGPIDNHQQSI